MSRTATRSVLTIATLAVAGLSLGAWLAAPRAWQPAGLSAAALGPVTLLLVVMLAPAVIAVLLRPKRALRDVLLLISGASAVLALAAGRTDLTVASLVVALFLTLYAPLWPEISDPGSSRTGWSLVIGSLLALTGLYLMDQVGGLMLAAAVIGLLAAGTGFTWGLLLLLRTAPLPVDRDSGLAANIYRASAESGAHAYALMLDKRWFWSRDRRAFLAYGARLDTAIVLGPGIGPRAAVDRLYREFQDECRHRGWKLGFYQVPGSLVDELGFPLRFRVGSEAIVDLRELTLEGPAMAKLRHEVSRGKRNGVSVTLQALEAVPVTMRAAMDRLAQSWNAKHALGEMAFSVGGHSETPNAPVMVALATDRLGQLCAYSTWIALPGSAGVVLDEIRRSVETPPGAMDLLLYTAMNSLRRSATWASLGLAPVATPMKTGRLRRIEDRITHRLGLQSVSASLYAFKNKFQPRWEPRFMTAQRLRDWPYVALATLLVHYPQLELRVRALIPSPTPPRRRKLAIGLAIALVTAGTSGVLAAAAQSRAGHPLYQAKTAATQVTAGFSPWAGHASKRSAYSRHHSIRGDDLHRGRPMKQPRALRRPFMARSAHPSARPTHHYVLRPKPQGTVAPVIQVFASTRD